MTAHGAQTLDGIVTRQANIIAYNNDWVLMMLLTIPMLPLVRGAKKKADGGMEHAAAMD